MWSGSTPSTFESFRMHRLRLCTKGATAKIGSQRERTSVCRLLRRFKGLPAHGSRNKITRSHDVIFMENLKDKNKECSGVLQFAGDNTPQNGYPGNKVEREPVETHEKSTTKPKRSSMLLLYADLHEHTNQLTWMIMSRTSS